MSKPQGGCGAVQLCWGLNLDIPGGMVCSHGDGGGEQHGGGDVVDCNNNHVVVVETILVNPVQFAVKFAIKSFDVALKPLSNVRIVGFTTFA